MNEPLPEQSPAGSSDLQSMGSASRPPRRANTVLQAQRIRELERVNRDLERANAKLERSCRVMSENAAAREQVEVTLKDAGRRKDEFIALLAHELRNPLAPIVNALELMKLRAMDDPDGQWCREVIGRQVTQLRRLVEDVLDVSRIAHDKITLQKEQLDLAAVVEHAVETVRPLVESHHHRLVIELPHAPVMVDGDPARLAQVLVNLLSNATKYTLDGGTIRLRVECNGAAVLIRVKDDGVGIPAEIASSVFELFTQLEPATDRVRDGLGIGLALVRQLVELHGGEVDVKSDGAGKGSEFTVRLPRLQAAAKRRRPVDAGGAAVPRPPAGRKVLVVDDNADAADSLAMVMRQSGYRVQTAYTGADAVHTARCFNPCVVLLDLGMPDMSGYETAGLIRQQPGGNGILLITLTGWSQKHVREAAARAGFDLHLVKPVDFAELHRLLSALPSCPVQARRVAAAQVRKRLQLSSPT